LVRGLDGDGKLHGGFILTGLRNGNVYKINLDNEQKTLIQESHSDGEVWGLATAGDGFFITSGDDNKIKTWNLKTRKCIGTGTICTEARKTKRGGASSLTELADS
jgi:WD40 repeat protein